MKKGASGASETPKPKNLGGTPLQVGEEDAARLVGGIVEKGFSDSQETRSFGPSAEPRPSVLPFPVARHRSHGPHWAPKVEKFNAVNDNDDMEEEKDGGEEDCAGMELVAGVANPVQKIEKKGLDFSRWQEIVKSEDNSLHHRKKKERHLTASDSGHKARERTSDKLGMQIAEPEDMKLSRARASFASNNETQENVNMHLVQRSHPTSGFAAQKLTREGEGSLESQIDSENRAQLAKMSTDEITEAQAEIMSKLNPELIKALKKRGLNKAKRQESSLSYNTGSEANSMQHEKYTLNSKASTDNSGSDKPVKVVPADTLKDESPSNISPKNSSAWDAWSKRVERVRDMRFSLDGNIISSGVVNISDTGDGSSESGYNPNNVSERDFLRSEGDPGAAGYTIKEAVALTRSVVPGQRTLALHLISTILDRAIRNICQIQVDSASRYSDADGSVDWEAIWAFALGPEPELALSLRMTLDDNHNSVVLSCAKAIQCTLSCDMNDLTFDISEKTPTYAGDICTAPVFRSKPDINAGFLHGGFWKYNTKPSNILCIGEESIEDKSEGEHTIQDDVVVAGQDFAAGLVRMGVLPRICYLLETDPTAPLKECLISILIAISRHSPTCAAAVMDCGRLVQTVASRFASKEQMGVSACKIKSVTLVKVLAQLEKKNCLMFIKNGVLRQVTWHLFRHPFSIDHWIKSGKEACKLSSDLLVEQLHLWKVFIRNGYCISDFSDLFASLCIWLSVPEIEKLIDNDVMNEYFAITKEVYLLLGDVAGRLPNFYLQIHERMENAGQDEENQLWGQFGSVVDQALEWIMVQRIPHVSRLFNCQNKDGEPHCLQESEINSLLWVVSSVLNMLSCILNSLIPADTTSFQHDHFPWLPDFVPRLGLEIIKNGYLRLSGVSNPTFSGIHSKNGSIVEYLCNVRSKEGLELAISSTCCLQGLVQVIASVDKLIQHTKLEVHDPASQNRDLSREDEVLANGIFNSCAVEIQDLLTTLMTSITNEWQHIQSVEKFGRGGPSPGVGVGWGAPNGGYWSLHSLLIQQDARLLTCLLEVSEMPFMKDPSEPGQINLAMQILNCALTACLVVGPGNSPVIDKILTLIFQVPVLMCLEFGIRQFLFNRKGCSPFSWNYKEDELLLFGKVLTAHFRNRWLSEKKKQKANGKCNHFSPKPVMKETRPLETIHEDWDVPVGEVTSSFGLEWAYQRLPLPAHWFLSAISTVQCGKSTFPPSASGETLPSNFTKIARAGLFFLLGVEVIPTFLGSKVSSPVRHVPVVWKLHAMSVLLLSGMSVLEDEKNRDIYETLQNVYGKTIDEERKSNLDGSLSVESLLFESDIHDNYSAFIEMLVEQFAAESYGDLLFGRQVAVYLHRSVEASVRLATWNALSNARVLELLPPLSKCFTKAEGYLNPIEDNERILESYVKSWVSGALDKAAARNSVAFSLALHHLASFIFGNVSSNMLSLRNKLAKSLIRDYSRKQQHEAMMVKLICYEKSNTVISQEPASAVAPPSSLSVSEIDRRLQLLKDAGDGTLASVQKLESVIKQS